MNRGINNPNNNMPPGQNGAQPGPNGTPITPNPKSDLNSEIDALKTLFTEKIKAIADEIISDANTITTITDRINEIINNNSSAGEKIKELKKLIEDVNEDTNLTEAKNKYKGEIQKLNDVLDGKSPNSEDSAQGDEDKDKGVFGNIGNLFGTSFTNKVKEQAVTILKSKGIRLSKKQLSVFAAVNDLRQDTLKNTKWINLNNGNQEPIDNSVIQNARKELVVWMNNNKTDEKKPDILSGGYLSNSRKLRRPSRRNTRDFFKFTRKSGESQGAKRMRKSRKKRRGRK